MRPTIEDTRRHLATLPDSEKVTFTGKLGRAGSWPGPRTVTFTMERGSKAHVFAMTRDWLTQRSNP
jgi:hypothetical protein